MKKAIAGALLSLAVLALPTRADDPPTLSMPRTTNQPSGSGSGSGSYPPVIKPIEQPASRGGPMTLGMTAGIPAGPGSCGEPMCCVPTPWGVYCSPTSTWGVYCSPTSTWGVWCPPARQQCRPPCDGPACGVGGMPAFGREGAQPGSGLPQPRLRDEAKPGTIKIPDPRDDRGAMLLPPVRQTSYKRASYLSRLDEPEQRAFERPELYNPTSGGESYSLARPFPGR